MKGCHGYFKIFIIAFGPLVGYDEMDYELHLLNVLLTIDNGPASPFFLSSCGLCQGDPLSPYFFLLIVEGISQAIHQDKRKAMILGVKVVGDISLTHLLFVDDVLIFCFARL